MPLCINAFGIAALAFVCMYNINVGQKCKAFYVEYKWGCREIGKLTLGIKSMRTGFAQVRIPHNVAACRRGLHMRRDNGGGHHREFEDADHVPSH